ncbi:Phosphatidylinositol/phosphatidylcholine transfer protein SFH7 [Symbiodinium microadriaticum]|uniref:Phosphatidylinositol/phosphatidylcholine transfer protein SFH7 n=1 Tax=Symbiodinium microadriaticum TaxID=2951 RepID=A0A1Q9E7P5_SYMMI|nr:Phosphatidylinositol/phosphatidylcholine transfer protein SFH7 [Symbiodinium microadriaticum]CAE7215208.1 SFH7 [Symbiodinium sp. KB8]CAE7248922.1 SFH7 [Symbiodinium microadriaticum]
MLADDPLVNAHFGHFMPSQEEIELTAQLLSADPELAGAKEFIVIHGDELATLRRFCWQAKQLGVSGRLCAEEALKLLRQCAEKRLKLGLDVILDRPSFPDELWSSFIETVPQTYHGLGLRGQPVVLIRAGGTDPSAMGELLNAGAVHSVDDVNAAVLCFLRCEECLFRHTVPRASAEVGHLVDRVILIVDLWGVGRGHFRFATEFLSVAVKQTVILYPETLDHVLVVNAAWSFATLLWPILKRLLHPVSQRKVVIADASRTREKLLEHLGVECLPSHFGGENEGIHMGCMLRPREPEAVDSATCRQTKDV